MRPITPMSWLMKISAIRSSATSSSKMSRISFCTVTSSAVVGSSAISSSGLQRQRNRDADPLALAAGQLVREGVDALFRLRHAHALQQLDRLGARLRARQPAVHDQAFGDLHADALRRIERRHRLLEDHADAPAAHCAHLPAPPA